VKRATPPRWLESLLARCLPRDVRGRSILGDLHEAVGERYAAGDVRAPLWYFWHAIRIAVRYAPANLFRYSALEGTRMIGLAQDARYALRTIRRDLRFFLFAALIIGLGIGANTAVFSVMSPLVLRPLPFADSERLVWVALGTSGGMSSVTSRTSNLRDFRSMSQSFEALTGYYAFFEYSSYNLVGDGQPERLVGVDVAQDFLDVLRVRPMLGRNFTVEEGNWGGPSVAILTHAFWARRFAADPSIVGSSITLNNQPTEVIGVLPPSFDFASTFTPGSRVDFLRPFPISDETDRQGNTLAIIGRLEPGSTVEGAQAELDDINRRLQAEQPGRWGLGAVVSGLQEQIAGRFRSAMVVLAAAAAAVMLIACANLSNLLLARGPKRQKEMAVRSALGANRHRLVRQLLIESLLLALCGGLIGVFIAFAATRAVAGTSAISIPMLHAVSIDATALWFTLGVSVLAGLLLGIIPALQMSEGGEAAVIRESSRRAGESKRHTRLREVLVVAEMALACVLVVSGGLLLRSFMSVLDVDLGFQPAGTMSWRVDTSRNFESLTAANVFYDQLVANVQAVPGVEAVGLTDTMPLGRNREWGLRAKGVFYEEGQAPTFFPRMVDWRYLEAMRIPLLAGRYLNAYDIGESSPVLIINQAAAERLFPEQDAIGQIVFINGDQEWQVVGVVGNVRHQSLEEASGLEGYLPISQMGDWGALDMVVRSSVPPATLVQNVRAALRATDPTMPTGEFQTLNAVVDRAVSPRRFMLLLLGAFAATALLLAALGIYGVLSYSVTQRTAEIGIRMALGETEARVLGRVMGRTMALASVGVGIGALGSVVAARLIGSLLFGVRPTDALTFSAVMSILLLVSALAGFLPARRAARTDPMVALQSS
jgi:putative ABC transport system permease protein